MEHLGWGLQMTVLGMGLVFSMLIVLWGILTFILFMDKEEVPAAAAALAVSEETSSDAALADDAQETESSGPAIINGMPADLVAAIMVAAMKHRENLRRQAAPITRTTWPGSQMYASRWVAAGRAQQNNSWQPKGR